MRTFDTYRGARRNAARDAADKVRGGKMRDYFVPLTGKRDRPMPAPKRSFYFAYSPRGKTYPAGWRTANERAVGPRVP